MQNYTLMTVIKKRESNGRQIYVVVIFWLFLKRKTTDNKQPRLKTLLLIKKIIFNIFFAIHYYITHTHTHSTGRHFDCYCQKMDFVLPLFHSLSCGMCVLWKY